MQKINKILLYAIHTAVKKIFTKMTILPAILYDIPQLVTLINNAYRGEESKKGWTTEAYLLEGKRIDTDGIKNIINQPDSVILKCSNDNNELTGCVYLKKIITKCIWECSLFLHYYRQVASAKRY